MKRVSEIALVALTFSTLGWFFGEPIRQVANNLLPSSLGGTSLLPQNRLPSARYWKEELSAVITNWQTAKSIEGFRQDYEIYQTYQPPVRSYAQARLIADWHEFNDTDLLNFGLVCDDPTFVDKILQLRFQIDPENTLSLVSALARDDSERLHFLKAWLVQASDGDRKRMRNLIVEHRLASSNDDPLLAFADSAEQLPPAPPKDTATEPTTSGEDVRKHWVSHKKISLLEASFRSWMKQAPEEARNWTASQEDPALLDLWRLCQVEHLIKAPGSTPRSAYKLSLEIAETSLQKRAVELSLGHWLLVDPQGAIASITEAPLEEAEREQLTQWANSKSRLLDVISAAASN